MRDNLLLCSLALMCSFQASSQGQDHGMEKSDQHVRETVCTFIWNFMANLFLGVAWFELLQSIYIYVCFFVFIDECSSCQHLLPFVSYGIPSVTVVLYMI